MAFRTLAETETVFQIMADQAPVMIWITDPTGYCTYLNQQWIDFTGQTLEEGLGLGWTEAVHPDDKEMARNVFIASNAAQSFFELDYRLKSKDGFYYWMLDRGKPRFDADGNYLGYIGTVTDISERKFAEEKLFEREERLQLALEATDLGAWDLNPLTGVLSWDDRTKELFGLPSSAQVDYDTFLKGLHPDDRERVDRIVQYSFQPESGGIYDTEFRTVGLEDQKLRWVRARGRAIFNEEGIVMRFIGTVLDITEAKTVESELKSSDERLREALMVTSTGTWKIDLLTGMDTRDAGLNKLLGLEARETEVSATDSFERIHIEDRVRIREAMDRAIAERGIYDQECRIFRPDGSMRWIRDRGQVVSDAKGEPIYIIGAAIDITDQKNREEALKVSEERFKSIFFNASVGMATANLNGKFLQVNPVFCQMLGYTAEELLLQDMLTITHPDFIADSIQKVQQTILGQVDDFVIRKKYKTKNGDDLWCDVSVSMVKDLDEKPEHLVVIVNNIHEKKLAEDALRLQARILESMDEGVSVVDEQGMILYTNAAEDRMFGYEQGELIGKHVTIQNAYPDEENARIVSGVIASILERGYWNGEWFNKRKDGTVFYTFAHITSLDLKGGVVMVCVQRDITEEKKAKEVMQRSAEELELMVKERTGALHEANLQLQRSNAELEQFAYVTSHDLQEPLRKIKTFAYRIEDLAKKDGNTTLQGYLDKVIHSSDRMSTLIRDLLNYSRLTKDEKQAEMIDLNEVLHNVLEDLEVLVTQKSATIQADMLPQVKGFSLQMNQLFFNLVSNSLKFAMEGRKPVIRISCRRQAAKELKGLSLKDGQYYGISFSDNGIGFDPKYGAQIFEIFQRLHSRDLYAGTGIGLALCKRVVENHHGAITAHSIEGEGATFTVYLPAS